MATIAMKQKQRWFHAVKIGPAFGKAVLGFGILICFTWSMIAGWSVTGAMVADSSARRTVAATSSGVSADTLQQKRDARSAIGIPRARGEVEADLNLELRKTSKQYPNGDGPKATALRGELAKIDRAAELDLEIAAAAKAYQDTPAVAAGDVEVSIPVGIVQRLGWVSADVKVDEVSKDAQFWFVVFFVLATGFFATFGFRLVGVTHHEISADLLWDKPIVWLPMIFLAVEAGMNAKFGYQRAGGGLLNPSAHLQAAMFAAVAVLGAYLPTRWDAVDPEQKRVQKYLDDMKADWGPQRLAYQVAAGVPHDPDVATRGHGSGTDSRPPRQPIGGGPRVPFPDDIWPNAPGVRPPAAPQAAAHGAPVNVYFSQAPVAGGHLAAVDAPQIPPPVRENTTAAGISYANDQAALPPVQTGAPVDRSRAQGRQDQCLLFRQACLINAPGALVSGDDMYARYLAWAGPQAMSCEAFLCVFGELADVPATVIGRELHFVDVAVSTAPHLLEVSNG